MPEGFANRKKDRSPELRLRMAGLSDSESEESFFLILLDPVGCDRVAGRVDRRMEIRFADRLLRKDHGFLFAFAGGDFLYLEVIAHTIVDVALTHPAHHAVNAERDFFHASIPVTL